MDAVFTYVWNSHGAEDQTELDSNPGQFLFVAVDKVPISQSPL